MFTFYGAKDSCSIPAQIILEMSGQPYENIYLNIDQPLPTDYLKLNPARQVPTLVEDGEVFTQCMGIATYLADKWPHLNLSPAHTSSQRGHYLKWIHFMNTSIHENFLRIYYPHKYSETEQGAQETVNAASSNLAKSFAIADDWINEGPFCLGNNIQVCDFYLTTLMSWHENITDLFSIHPKLKALFESTLDYQPASEIFKEHGVVL